MTSQQHAEAEPSTPHRDGGAIGGREVVRLAVVIGALGVVFGDIVPTTTAKAASWR